jgi:hypothetical protein
MLKVFSPHSRKILLILIAITVVSRLALAFRPEARLASRTYIEDAFYAFNTAYHITEGNGITADGIHPTNGIQPLIVFLYVPFFAIADGDKWLAIRLIFILIALLEVASIIVLARLLKRLSCVEEEEVPWWQRPWIAGPAMWTFLYPLLWHHGNGLETGLYALMILSSMYFYAGIRVKDEDESVGNWIVLGALLGITVLARIDAVFLVGGIGLTELIRRRTQAIPQMILMAAAAFVVSSPWWFYNFTEFGSFMPISGQSQSQVSVTVDNLMRAAAVLADIGSTFFYMPYYLLPPMLMTIWIVFVFATAWRIGARISLWKFLPERSRIEILMPLAVMGVCIFIFYVFFFSAPHFLPRYFHPIRLLWLLFVCLSLPLIGKSIEASYREHKRSFYVFGIPIALLIIGFSANRYTYNFYVTRYNELYEAGVWAAERPDKRVGMYQSGTATFVAPNVTNLDGKVNPDAMNAIRHTGIGPYLQRERFDYLADVSSFVEPLVDSARKYGVNYSLVDSASLVYIYQRVD